MAYKYYEIRNTIRRYPEAMYYAIYGERSNGKTYSSLDYCLENYFKYGEQFAYVRRWGEDIKRKEMTQLFAGHVHNHRIEALSGKKWQGIDYYAGQFYANRHELTKTGKDDWVRTTNPIGFAFDLNNAEHYKSISYPNITTIVFDEFLSRRAYIPNEFLLFTNLLSTIIRNRRNVKVIMLGNTVNKYSPYFQEMGLTHINQQKPGETDIYKYGDSGLIVVCEYCESSAKRGGKESDIYFAFDNPGLKMIREGAWEMAIYPRIEESYRPGDVVTTFFIEFYNEMLHCDIVCNNQDLFCYVHRKTTPIKHPYEDIVYTTRADKRWNYRSCLTKQRDKLTVTILKMLNEDRFFYSSNDVGETFRNYIIWSTSHDIRMS